MTPPMTTSGLVTELHERIDARHDDGCHERRTGEEHQRDEIPNRVDPEMEDASAKASNAVPPFGQGRRDERGTCEGEPG